LLEQELRALGFEHFVTTRHGETVDLDGLRATLLAFTAPADGPLGDSLIVLDDGDARVLNQNDARPGDLDALRALGPFDAQIVPGSAIELDGGECKVTHPAGDQELWRPFVAKRAYLEEYRRDWSAWLEQERAGWSHARRDLVSELAPWFEPLLLRAPITSAGI